MSRLHSTAAPRFRVEFELPSGLVGVRAYVSGLGSYSLFVDGNRIGDSRLDPGWRAYDMSAPFVVHDLDGLLHPSSHGPGNRTLHTIGVELGNGFYNPLPLRIWGHLNIRDALVAGQGRTSSEPCFRLLLLGRTASGTAVTLASSSVHGGWQGVDGPTTFNSIYLGEAHDAHIAAAQTGWALSGFNTSGWSAAVAASSFPTGQMEPVRIPPIRRQGALTAKLLSVRQDGKLREAHTYVEAHPGSRTRHVYDAGRNMAGVCRYRITGSRGAVARARYGEELYPDGSLNPMTSVARQIKGPNKGAPCQPSVAYQETNLTLNPTSPGTINHHQNHKFHQVFIIRTCKSGQDGKEQY